LGWKIEFARSAEKDLKKIDPLDDPRSIGEPLHGPELGRFWKYRVGHFRIIASIEDGELAILIVRIGHRSNVYR
jgi:mRNA interferase RelE/StbE